MRITHRKALLFTGATWLAIGLFLLYKGFFLLNAISLTHPPALVRFCMRFVSQADQGVLALVVAGLFLGFLKSRLALSKTVDRVTKRIEGLEEPIRVGKMYSRGYLILLLCMMGLGISLRFLPVQNDLRGLIDVAIGSGLMNAGMVFMRSRSRQATLAK